MWTNFQYVKIPVILDRLLVHPLLSDLNLERAVQYTIDFIGIMGLPPIYKESMGEVDIVNYRGFLPCDLISINQVKLADKEIYLRSMTNNFNTINNSVDNKEELTFKTLGRILHTSLKEGKLLLSYTSIPVDEEGYPLLPDESTFLRALELYIKKQWFTILFDMGKISLSVLLNTQLEYAFAVGSCNNTFLIPSVSEMESLTNILNQMLPRHNEFNKGFKHLGSKEYLRTH